MTCLDEMRVLAVYQSEISSWNTQRESRPCNLSLRSACEMRKPTSMPTIEGGSFIMTDEGERLHWNDEIMWEDVDLRWNSRCDVTLLVQRRLRKLFARRLQIRRDISSCRHLVQILTAAGTILLCIRFFWSRRMGFSKLLWCKYDA